jgi:hypothetical protein
LSNYVKPCPHLICEFDLPIGHDSGGYDVPRLPYCSDLLTYH